MLLKNISLNYILQCKKILAILLNVLFESDCLFNILVLAYDSGNYRSLNFRKIYVLEV